MPDIVKLKKQVTIKQFTRKKLLVAILLNVIFNPIFCYFNFIQDKVLYLIEGYHSLGKMMLAMAAFIPFMITFDILWNARQMSQKGEIDFVLDEYFEKNKSIFKLCGINSLYTWLCAFAVIMILHVSLPDQYQFNSIKMAVVCGIIAGVYTIIFTLVSVRQLKKHIIMPIKLPIAV
ncbi:MAG: hypothetical protein AAGC65_18685 [Mucilaginibacter sp.]|uniref:hypothetical protein n=1 Tax=Mucilaginibacter sp. TaxID=1882438 RepID=UPI0031B1F028